LTNHLEIKEELFKLEQDFTLFQNEKCIVKIFKQSFALPVLRGDETVGYVFHGKGELVIDALIETSKGTIGKPIERLIETPFIMIAPTEKIKN